MGEGKIWLGTPGIIVLSTVRTRYLGLAADLANGHGTGYFDKTP